MIEVTSVPEAEYRAHRAISNSDLGLLAVSPKAFYQARYEGVQSEGTKSQLVGSLIDCKILTPELFEERYIMMPEEAKAPSSNQMRFFCEQLKEGVPCSEAYAKSYAVKSKKQDEIDRLATGLELEMRPWMEFMANVGERTVYTISDSQVMHGAVQAIMGNDRARMLLMEHSKPQLWAKSQVTIFFSWMQVDAKAMLDRIVIDTERKIIYLIDLKTTSKPLHRFYQEVEYWNYDRQQAFYSLALQSFLVSRLGIDKVNEYNLVNVIVAVETTGLQECRVYAIPDPMVQRGLAKAIELMERYKYHVDSGKWDHTKEYYENGGWDKFPDEIIEGLPDEEEVSFSAHIEQPNLAF
jgi:hypothetical protein